MKTETTAELVLRSALELHVCSHLNVAVTLEFSQLNSSLDSLAHEINLRQYHKEFIWTSPDDRAWSLNEVWVNGLEGRDEQTCRNCSQLSSVSSHAERIAFLSGFQFGFSVNCGARPHLDSAWGREMLPHPLAQVRQGYGQALQTQEPKLVKAQRFLDICYHVWHISKRALED